MKNHRLLIGKFLYGFLFVVLIPVSLLVWSSILDRSIKWPIPDWPVFSGVLVVFALFLMLKGMLDLYVYGRGLPMNAYPPRTLVKQGLYAWFAHPIYLGAVLLSAGLSLEFHSSSGLYIITPILAMMILSLLYGYELSNMEKLFGKDMLHYHPLFSFPSSDDLKTSWVKKVAMMLRVLLPWLAIGFFLDYARSSASGFMSLLTLHSWQDTWTLLWMLPFLYILIRMLSARTERELFHVTIIGTLATGLGLYAYLILPVPAFHATETNWELLLINSVALILAINYRAIWSGIQRISERVANSRHDWFFAHGHFRIINHGMYSGLAGALGVGIVSFLLGNNFAALLLIVCVLIGAAVFAQSLWGSGQLLRPFGYWGAILGGIVGIGLISFFFNIPLMMITLAGVLCAPFVQAVGRLRCLVQGCCHGVVTNKQLGIQVWHPQSRVVALSGLKGAYILNTQFYSIAFNLLLGLLLWRMWQTHNIPSSFIIGSYMIFTGIERFTEDAYRGEKQTRKFKGLRENQWIAIAACIIGTGISMIPASPPPNPAGSLTPAFLVTVVIGGLLTAFAMSMDFPKSQRRFSRLSG